MTSAVPPTGIAAFGLHLPALALPVKVLAKLRDEEPEKYTLGLGLEQLALCPHGYTIVDLAAEAAQRALARWGGDPARIGLLAVGTENGVDMSRPLSAWVANRLGLAGALRSYEVKHSSYAGTLALRQALEWRLSGAAGGRAALVVAADIALYEPEHPAEPTQGAGAVAMVVDSPDAAWIDPISYPWSEPEFDIWQPVGEPYPNVQGALSLDCYQRAAMHCFRELLRDRDPEVAFAGLARACFHCPFPELVHKTVFRIGEGLGWHAHQSRLFFERYVQGTMAWNRKSGHAYSASLWLTVAHALRGQPEGAELLAFSYGSGFGAELLQLRAGPLAAEGAWAEDIARDLEGRKLLTGKEYEALRREEQSDPEAVPVF